MPLSFISNIIGSILGHHSQKQTNAANEKMTRETNLSNRQMQQQANQAQVAQNELAYQRSKASSQVIDMMNAGMSKGAALNAINGGGTYTPAPISASVDQAPQHDNAGTLQALQMMTQGASNYAQRKDEMKRFNEQMRVQAEEAEANRQHQRDMQIMQHGNEMQKIEMQHNYDYNKWLQEFNEQKRLNQSTLDKMHQDTELTREERDRLTRMFELQVQKARVDIAKVTADVKLSTSQKAKIDQEVEHMSQVIAEWQETGDVRKAEAEARKVIANCQKITESAGYQVTKDVLGGVMDLVKTFLPSNVVTGLFGKFFPKAP